MEQAEHGDAQRWGWFPCHVFFFCFAFPFPSYNSSANVEQLLWHERVRRGGCCSCPSLSVMMRRFPESLHYCSHSIAICELRVLVKSLSEVGSVVLLNFYHSVCVCLCFSRGLFLTGYQLSNGGFFSSALLHL